jgi:hypothetical protein
MHPVRAKAVRSGQSGSFDATFTHDGDDVGARPFLNEVAKIATTATFSHAVAANKNSFYAATS